MEEGGRGVIMHAGRMLPQCKITVTGDFRRSPPPFPPQRTSGDVLLGEDKVSHQQDQQSTNLNLSTHWPAMRETLN